MNRVKSQTVTGLKSGDSASVVRTPADKDVKEGRHFRQLIGLATDHNPIRTAVVHPVDALSLRSAIEAANAHLISPILVGPEIRIRDAAERTHLDLSPYDIVNLEHSHTAAAQAVAMALEHKVDALMRGSLPAEELMAFVDMAQGLRSERRMSHVFAVDTPILPRPVFVTDAVLNSAPTLAEKRDIIQNAIELLHALAARGLST
jgi:phosphate acetyltransferase/phosphate butyryltransferase